MCQALQFKTHFPVGTINCAKWRGTVAVHCTAALEARHRMEHSCVALHHVVSYCVELAQNAKTAVTQWWVSLVKSEK